MHAYTHTYLHTFDIHTDMNVCMCTYACIYKSYDLICSLYIFTQQVNQKAKGKPE